VGQDGSLCARAQDRSPIVRRRHMAASRNGPRGRAASPKRQRGDTFSGHCPSLTLRVAGVALTKSYAACKENNGIVVQRLEF